MSGEIQGSVSDSLHISVSDDDLLSKLADTKNSFVERKTVSDHRGWSKTAVAFANSFPVGYPGVLFVGGNNDGTIERHNSLPNCEKLHKSVSERLNDAWPPIFHFSRTLRKGSLEWDGFNRAARADVYLGCMGQQDSACSTRRQRVNYGRKLDRREENQHMKVSEKPVSASTQTFLGVCEYENLRVSGCGVSRE
jgi:hypothetical protein